MNTNGSTTPADESDTDRDFGTIEMPTGDVVIYAKADHSRWVQSDTAVDLEEMR